MLDRLDPPDRAKLAAAYHAMAFVEDDMRLGLGSGSTAAWLVRLLGARRFLEGLKIEAVSTSEATERLARAVGIHTTSLDHAEWLDLTIDGADELDGQLRLIKGGGGALLREKIVATASERMLVIADEGKVVETLGAYPLPVEVVNFGLEATKGLIAEVLQEAVVDGDKIVLRRDGRDPFVTDEGHLILDLHLNQIDDVEDLQTALLAVPGVVETGLFLGIASSAAIGYPSGEARIIGLDEAEDPDASEAIDEDRLAAFLDHMNLETT